jgi:hypothetical protein
MGKPMNKLTHMMIGAIAASLLPAGAACGAPPNGAPATAAPKKAAALSAAQAIAAAAKSDQGAQGVFQFAVASVGKSKSRRGGSAYLNSEADFHDPRNVSVRIPAKTVKDIETALGHPLEQGLVGKRIAVTGVARRIEKAHYDKDRKRTGETYAQTQIAVTSADQIVVLR